MGVTGQWKIVFKEVIKFEAANFKASIRLIYSYLLMLIRINLIRVIILGLYIVVSSRNLFLVWLGMEIKMFGVIPFLINDKKNTSRSMILYYFIIQVLGRILFAWRAIKVNRNIFGIVGLCIKSGLAPFFWWVPKVISSLNWNSIFIMSTFQKIPPLIGLVVFFDYLLDYNIIMLFIIMGLVIGFIGMKLCTKKIKMLIAWSSIANVRFVYFLLGVSTNLGIIYFVFYRLNLFIILKFINNKVSKRDISTENLIAFGGIMLIFSGLPPLLGFVTKLVLFKGFDIWSSHSIISWMWWVSLILVLQIIAYIKIFIKSFRVFNQNLHYNVINMWWKGLLLFIISLILFFCII